MLLLSSISRWFFICVKNFETSMNNWVGHMAWIKLSKSKTFQPIFGNCSLVPSMINLKRLLRLFYFACMLPEFHIDVGRYTTTVDKLRQTYLKLKYIRLCDNFVVTLILVVTFDLLESTIFAMHQLLKTYPRLTLHTHIAYHKVHKKFCTKK